MPSFTMAQDAVLPSWQTSSASDKKSHLTLFLTSSGLTITQTTPTPPPFDSRESKLRLRQLHFRSTLLTAPVEISRRDQQPQQIPGPTFPQLRWGFPCPL